MKVAVVNFLAALCMLLFIQQGTGADEFNFDLLAKADIDECYNGVGETYVPYDPDIGCKTDEIPKANHAYLWGLTKSGNSMWIGTGSNILCLMRGLTFSLINLGESSDENDLWVCEYREGKYPSEEIDRWIPRNYGDFREPKIYKYDIGTDPIDSVDIGDPAVRASKITDITAKITDDNALKLLENTFGLRSAGSIGNIVFIAGPTGVGKGINIFAFNATTETLIDAKKISTYSNIRKWLVMGNNLYTTVENSRGGGSKVLKWIGTETNPIAFIVVGDIDGIGAEIAEHNERIYVGTWPQGINKPMGGIWQSPVVPDGSGLTTMHADDWKKVWTTDEYEPDPLIAHLYGVGALHSYKDQLYWGTMHVTSKNMFRVVLSYTIKPTGWAEAFEKSKRAISIFRTTDFDSVELLYGDAQLPVYTRNFFNGTWSLKNNNMGGSQGTYGTSGFGNSYNNYTWAMAVYDGKLFVGTMDNSILWKNAEVTNPAGADLWCFPSENQAAVPVTDDGFGNMTNYGIRTIYSDSTGLYCGTANPGNIAQDDDDNPIGGWELIRVK